MLEIFELVGKAVADPSRIRILKLLEMGELCVCQITAVLELAPATISKHLAILKSAGLVLLRRDGRWGYYRLADRPLNPFADRFLALLRDLPADDPTLRADRRRLADISTIPLQTLCAQRKT